MKIMQPSNIVITSSNVTGSSYSNWAVGTAYTTGQYVYLASNYGEYQALTNSTGKDPSVSPTEWKFLGTTNKYRMFDQFLNTQTSRTGTIEVDVVAYGSSGIYLGNLEALSVTIEVVDNDSLDVIESQTFSMYRDVSDWKDYFYGDWIENRKDSIFYERTTLTRNISYVIAIDSGANTAKCGICFIGQVKDIGVTKLSPNIGALDYSTVAIDTESGATYLQKGNYAKRMSIDIFAYTSTSNAIFKVLNDSRGTPIVFIGGGYDLLNVYGYVQKFEQIVAGPVETAISVDIIGLI